MNKSIMIIEDDFETQMLFSEFLKSESFDVLAMNDGLEALAYLKENDKSPDLILMDLTMPGMEPDEFVLALRKEKRHSNIPLILVSGKSDIAAYAEKFHAQDFFRKPFDIDPLIASVKSHS